MHEQFWLKTNDNYTIIVIFLINKQILCEFKKLFNTFADLYNIVKII